MPKVGDRVIIQGGKVGGARREGTLLGQVGSLMKVRWVDGSESLFSPGAGAVEFLPGNGKSKAAGKAATKTAAKAAKPAKTGKIAGKAAVKAAAKPAKAAKASKPKKAAGKKKKK